MEFRRVLWEGSNLYKISREGGMSRVMVALPITLDSEFDTVSSTVPFWYTYADWSLSFAGSRAGNSFVDGIRVVGHRL